MYLGGGLYMNSRGELSHGPEPDKPVYRSPGGGLPVDMGAFAKAFQGVAKALPDKDDPKSRQKFDKILDGIGMAAADKENLIGVLQGIGAVASVIGSVVPVVGAVLGVLTALLGLFKSGPSALELMIERQFDELRRRDKALETQAQQHDLRDQLNVIKAALAVVNNYVVELKNSPPDGDSLRLRRQDVRSQITASSVAVRNLLDTSTWLTTFDPTTMTDVWPWRPGSFYAVPKTGAPRQALMPASGSNVFDHRLMVPLASFGVTAFLTLLRSSAPEFRSTRENREDLWDFAAALEVLIDNMRGEGITRTLHTAWEFDTSPAGGIPWQLDPSEVVDLSLLGVAPHLAADNTRWVVGAFDVRAHNDGYFTPGFSASRIQLPGPQYAKQGLLDVRWMPPAKLEPIDVPVSGQLGWERPNQRPLTERRYLITNPQACADAANAQAEQNFADLLYSSGYLTLVHLLSTVRNEATDPDRSQTVRADTVTRRMAGAERTVVVEAKPFLSPVMTTNARQQDQQYRSISSFTTQPLGRDRKLHYRVWLRTLSASMLRTGGEWIDDNYAAYHRVDYWPDNDHPGCFELTTTTGQELDSLKLVEGVTEEGIREHSGTAKLTADTYDNWIPLRQLGHLDDAVRGVPAGIAALRAEGWESGDTGTKQPPAPAPQTTGSRFANPLTSTVIDAEIVGLWDTLGWVGGGEPSGVLHKNIRSTQIHLDYTVRWEDDRLTITLRNNRPVERNYVVYVVVEEALGSGNVLHTFAGIPVAGQLTFVPQSFLDEVDEATERAERMLNDFNDRYSESVGVGPRLGGPPERVLDDLVFRALDLTAPLTDRSASGIIAAALGDPVAARLLRQVAENHDMRGVLRATAEETTEL
ncbi:hypothetical protein GCM10022382_16480 [Microbacterium invictum]